MATKSMTVTTEAYERLAVLKEDSESFSDVITKLTGKHSVLRLVGLLSDDETAELKKNVKKTRKIMRRSMERTAGALNDS